MPPAPRARAPSGRWDAGNSTDCGSWTGSESLALQLLKEATNTLSLEDVPY